MNPTTPKEPPKHPHFLGPISREDMQALEQIRGRIMPMMGHFDKYISDMHLALHRGDAIPFTQVQRTTNTLNTYLAAINAHLNGSYRHTATENEDGNKVYLDYVNEGNAARLGALHVYPQAPYPMGDERLAGMALVLLEKRLGTNEEKWVDERIRRASEFAYVPDEWGIEPRKPAASKEEEEDSEDEDMKGWDKDLPTKRVQGSLKEDDIMDMWTNGHKTAFNREYWSQMGWDDAEEEGETPAVGSDLDMEDEEEEEEAPAPPPPPPPPVVMIQRAAPAVHKPVPGAPVMSLGVVHRFMSCGDVQAPVGKR